MALFRPARPVGCRASSQGHNEFQPLIECQAELISLARNELDPELSPSEAKVLSARLVDLIRLLRNGQVIFDGRDPQASTIHRHDCLYELRPRVGRGRLSSRELRLYCGEPHRYERWVLGLHVATKPSRAPDRLAEQNQAIDEAFARVNAWELRCLKEHT